MNLFPLPNLVKRHFLLALLASSFVPFSSVKAFREYEDQAEFLTSFADSSEYITETFSGLPEEDQEAFSISFTHFTLITTEDEANGLWKSNLDGAGGPWLGTLDSGKPLTLTFGEGVLAVGMYFSLTDLDDIAQDGNIFIRFNNGDWLGIESSSAGNHPYFAAKATDPDELITTLEIMAPATGRWATVAAVTVAPVPEPSTYLLFGASAIAFLALKRRRQTSRG